MKIGFIGTGNMGKPMAANLIKAGHQLTVFDKSKSATDDLVAQGARWADTPRAVAQASQITISSVPGPREVEEVALGKNGVFEGAARGHFYIDMSTCSPSVIRKIAAAGAASRIDILDAPVSGGVKGATDGTLTVMVGGSPEAFKACEPILKCIGQRVFHVGEVGTGYVAKLVNNIMAIGNTLIAMEAMVMGVKAGADAKKLFDIVDSSSGGSTAMRGTFSNRIFTGKFDPPSFALSLAAKDVKLAIDYARELGVPMEIGQLVSATLADMVKRGLGGRDLTARITVLEDATGIQIRVPKA